MRLPRINKMSTEREEEIWFPDPIVAYYHRCPYDRCCIMAGDIDGGGLVRLLPVLGLTIGMAFRGRKADG